MREMKLLWGSLIVASIITIFEPMAHAQYFWTNSGDDTWSNDSNWVNGTGIAATPGSTDSALISPGFTYSYNNTEDIVDIANNGNADITITNTTGNQTVYSLAVSSYVVDNENVVHSIDDGVLNLDFENGTTLSTGGGFGIVGASTVNFTGNLDVTGGELVVGSTATSIVGYSYITGSGTLNINSGSSVDLDGGFAPLVIGQGTTGLVTQADATLATGELAYIGTDIVIGTNSTTSSGTGTYSLTAGSTLNIGPDQLGDDYFLIGAGGSSTGTLNITDSTLNAINADPTTIILGLDVGDTGTITESGSSNVNIENNSLLDVAYSGTGTYNLESGNLNILDGSTLDVGVSTDATGYFVQTGGNVTVDSTSSAIVGDAGYGSFTMSSGSGTNDFQDGLTIGNQSGSTGIFTQNGGVVTVEGSPVLIGNSGTGTYNLNSAASATFNDGAIVGTSGTFNLNGGSLSFGGNTVNLMVSSGGVVNQNSGTYAFNSNEQLDLSAGGSSYNLKGGTLQVTAGAFVTGSNGNLNFGGGTLQITGSGTSFTDPYNGILANGTVTTIDGSNGTVTSVEMAGSLSGSGGIEFLGSGTNTAFSFGSTNTYTGSTVIENGTLTANLSQIGSSDLIDLTNSNSVLDYQTAGGGTDKLSSVLTGSGTLNVSFTDAGDTLELANKANNSFTGTINLGSNGNNGTLQIFNGSFGAITEGAALSNVTIGGDSSVTTSGTVTFSQDETYTGTTTISSGFKLNALNLAGSVTNNGTFGINTTNPSTITITDDFTSSGTILFRYTNGTPDLYQINGTTNLSGGSGTITGSGNTPLNGVVVLNSTGGLTGFTAANYTTSNALFSATITQSSDQLILHTDQMSAATFAQTPNQLAVASAIDPVLTTTGLPGNLGLALNSLSAAQIPGALDELSPEVLQYSRDIAFENSTFLAQQVNGVLANVRLGYAGLDTSGISIVSSGFNSGLGQSLTSLLAYDPPSFNKPAPNGVNYYPQPAGYSPATSPPSSSDSTPSINSGSISDSPNPETTVPPSSMSRSEPDFKPVMSEFILGNVVLADMNQNQSAPNAAPDKASYTASNVTGGISFRMTNNLAAGILFNYNHTDAKTDSSGSKTDVDSYSPGVYATWFDKGFYVNGLFSYGYNTYTNNRNISFLGATANSSPNGQQYVTSLDLGYDFQPKNHHEWIFGPSLGLTYTHLDINSFTESGAGDADLAVNSQSLDSLRSQLGGHVVYQARVGSMLLQPNFTALWQHEYLNNPGITSQLNIPGTNPFTIQTATTGDDSALLGCGLTLTLDNSMAFFVNYLADVGSNDFWAQSFVGGFKASF